MRLDNVSEQGQLYLKFMLYGESGAGKTTLLGTAMDVPEMSPLLILNCVGNPFSLRRMVNPPTVIHLESYADIETIYSWLDGGQDPKHDIPKAYEKKYGKPMPLPFKTVAVDSTTGLNGMYMRQSLGLTHITDTKKATFDNWGGLLQYNEAIGFNFLEKLQMHVIITALEWVEIDQLTSEKSWGVALYGKGQQVLPSYAYLTARIVRMQKIRADVVRDLALSAEAYSVAFFDQVGKFAAKDLYGLGLRYMSEPTMARIWAAMNIGRGEGTTNPTDSKG